MKKIVQINSVYGIGSTGRIVESIHNNLMQNGIESHVIVGRRPPIYNLECRTNVHGFFSKINLYTDAIQSLIFDTHGLHSKNNTKKIIELLNDLNPNVIHLHNIHGFYINYVMLFEYLNKKKIKIIWTLHDCWVFTGYCCYFDYNECNEYKSGCKQCNFRNVYPYRLLSNSSNNYKLKEKYFNISDITYVTPSNWLKQTIEQCPNNNKKIQVIKNGIETKYFKKLKEFDNFKLNGKKILLGVSNEWTKSKGYLEYIRLSKLISDEYVIVLIGLNAKQIEKFKSYDNIIGYGKTTSVNELAIWYNKAYFFINLTLEDNYPTVNLEAYECDCRMLGYETGGSTEMINLYGETVEKYDVEAINKLILEDKSYIKIEVDNSADKMISNYIELYRKIGVLDD